MTAYLMTRGTPRGLDYAFVGHSPGSRWWAPLDDWVVLERPEVLVHGGSSGGGVLVSGIPSARRDDVGTAIRFTVVLAGGEPDAELLTRLAAIGLDPGARAALGQALDGAFGVDEVDATLAGSTQDEGVDSRVVRAIRELDGAVAPPAGSGGRPADGGTWTSWAGSRDDPRAVARFLERAAQLVDGAPGWAFTTAALGTEDGARRAADALDEPVAVLLGEGGPPEVVDLGKEPAGRPTVAARRPRVRPAVLVAVVLIPVLVLGLITIVIGMGAVSLP